MRHVRARSGGFTIIETVVAMLIISGVLMAAMKAVVSTNRVREAARERTFAVALCEDMLAEACSKKYEDPSAGGLIGTDTNDTVFPRSMDDVDDYEQVQETPPYQPDFTPVPGSDGWKRVTRVEYVDPANPSTVVASDQGVKRVSVTVSKNGRAVLTLVALRTKAWDKAKE